MSHEYLDVLDPQGNPTGRTKLRSEVHRDGDWHRTVHIWIVNSKGQILMQKRSPHKESNPGKWDISAAGHIPAGETSLDTAVRETEEELGIHVRPEEFEHIDTVTSSSVQNDGTFVNNSIHDIYILKKDLEASDIRFQVEEVDAVKWVPIDELRDSWKRQSPDIVMHPNEYPVLFEYLSRQ